MGATPTHTRRHGKLYTSLRDLAAAEKINESYLARVLRLTLLAPDIIEAILDGRQPVADLQLDALLKPFPTEWRDQRASLLTGATPD